MNMKLVKGWQTWWRQWSSWLIFASGVIFNLDLVGSFLYAWNLIPEDIKSSFPSEWRQAIGTALLVIAFVARYVQQRKLHEKVYKGDDKAVKP